MVGAVVEVGDNLYAWQVQEPDGQWSMVGAMVGNEGGAPMIHTPLIHRKLDTVGKMRPMAESHAQKTGQPLRLARFTLAEVEPDDLARGGYQPMSTDPSDVTEPWDSNDPQRMLSVLYWLQEWGDKWWISPELKVFVFPRNPSPKLPRPGHPGDFFDASLDHELVDGDVLRHSESGWVEVVAAGSPQ